MTTDDDDPGTVWFVVGTDYGDFGAHIAGFEILAVCTSHKRAQELMRENRTPPEEGYVKYDDRRPWDCWDSVEIEEATADERR